MDTSRYQEPVNGIYYHKETPLEVVRILERARLDRMRVMIRLGDRETGRDWGDEHDVEGRIGNSCGPLRVPLLISSPRNIDGFTILDHCILRLAASRDGKLLYQAPNYRTPTFTTGPPLEASQSEGYIEAGYTDGQLTAQFRKPGQAARWVKKMQRYCGLPKTT